MVDELSKYDTLIIIDLSHGTLGPHFHPDSIPGPNLLRIVHDFVENGGGLVYCGGWMTFQGYQGVGHGTPVADTLPIDIRPIYDDRIERPEGAEVTVTDRDHPVMSAVGDKSLPVVYGYNQVGGLRDGTTELGHRRRASPLGRLRVRQGRVLTYTSDPSQWGLALVDWEEYDRFWLNAIEWAAQE